MYFVYILESKISHHYYIGHAINVYRRLDEHNDGKCLHTKKYRPWKLITFLAFEGKRKAISFEKYLKTGSGRAFQKRHF